MRATVRNTAIDLLKVQGRERERVVGLEDLTQGETPRTDSLDETVFCRAEVQRLREIWPQLDGETLTGVEMVSKLNELGGKNGIGLADIIENRLVGMKSRGVYETPGGTILYHAHNKLEELCLDKETYHYKQQVALKFADLVYNGQWYTPLRQALSAFVDSTQETVTGDVKLKLYKGNIIDAGVTSPYSLYDEEIATFDEDEVYNQADSAGFINLFGLPIKVQAKKGLTYDK